MNGTRPPKEQLLAMLAALDARRGVATDPAEIATLKKQIGKINDDLDDIVREDVTTTTARINERTNEIEKLIRTGEINPFDRNIRSAFAAASRVALRLADEARRTFVRDPSHAAEEQGPEAASGATDSGPAGAVIGGAAAGAAAGAAVAGPVGAAVGSAAGAVAGAVLSGGRGAATTTQADGGVPGAGLEFAGQALPLTEEDLRQAAQDLGCELAALKAVAEVESRGKGFLPDGRPKILFEAHVFSRLTGRRHDATHPRISSRIWNRTLYEGGAAEYGRLSEAMALDRAAALESASWGRFQIMGFNHAAAGFGDVEAYVAAMCRSEGEQLRAVVAFIHHNPAMLQALLALDWRTFARLYNGPGQVDEYAAKLDKAYRRFSSS